MKRFIVGILVLLVAFCLVGSATCVAQQPLSQPAQPAVYEAYCGGGGGSMMGGGMMMRPMFRQQATMQPMMMQQPTMSGCETGQCSMSAGSMGGTAMMRPQLLVPQTTYQPYQYQGTVVQRRDYRTPVRDALFGSAVQQDIYAPVQQANTPSVAQSAAPGPGVTVSVANLPSGEARPLAGNVVVIQRVIR